MQEENEAKNLCKQLLSIEFIQVFGARLSYILWQLGDNGDGNDNDNSDNYGDNAYGDEDDQSMQMYEGTEDADSGRVFQPADAAVESPAHF